MAAYAQRTAEELQTELAELTRQHRDFAATGLKLNMARGKPCADQLDLSMPLFDAVTAETGYLAEDGTDCRNYGVLDGIPEAKRLMAELLEDSPERTVVFGGSSLQAMHFALSQCLTFGTGGHAPWNSQGEIAWICPVPGYDRHFGICEEFGIRMIPVPMESDGPDMDAVESLAASEASIKGIWCVPQYANPTGVTYSDETVRRLAGMACAAPDFRIFWDNAYCVHHLSTNPAEQDHVLDIGAACREAGNPDRAFKFASTSKITFPGAGLAAMAASEANIASLKRHLGVSIIGFDKLNQLRHVRFLRDRAGIEAHMDAHATILAPKFAMVQQKLHDGLAEAGIAQWSDPRGGYFVSFDGMPGTAKRTIALAKEAGVVMTGAGATWPYHDDPNDANIRIAPTMPPLDELERALDVFVCCTRIAAIEALLSR